MDAAEVTIIQCRDPKRAAEDCLWVAKALGFPDVNVMMGVARQVDAVLLDASGPRMGRVSEIVERYPLPSGGSEHELLSISPSSPRMESAQSRLSDAIARGDHAQARYWESRIRRMMNA